MYISTAAFVFKSWCLMAVGWK